MKAKKGLQKLTNIDTKIKNLLSLEQITLNDFLQLNEPEKDRFSKIINDNFKNLKGEESDRFLKKINSIINEDTKNQLWEYNHNKIMWAISTLMQEYGRMPTKTEIANQTELSRQTVHKHLKEFATHPIYLEQIEQFKFMTSKVLAKVFHFAVNGDVGAAKLYFNVMGALNTGQTLNNTLIQNQNNYIQINGTVLSQETVKHLNPEQLNTIETILKTTLPQTESVKHTLGEPEKNNWFD